MIAVPDARRTASSVAKRWQLVWLRRGIALLAFFAAVEYLVLPQIAGTRTALHLLGSVQPGWLIAGFGLEALSLMSYSLLTRSVLPAGCRPAFSWLFRTDLTALGLSHVVPGGTVSASPLRYRLLKEGGTAPEDAVVGATVEGIGSTFILVVIFWLALILSIPFTGLHVLYIAVATLVAVVMGLIAAGAMKLTGRTSGPVDRVLARLPARIRVRLGHALTALAAQLGRLLADRTALRESAAWAAGSWLLDAASLWVFLAAYGVHANPVALLVGYGVANLVAILPVSPGGLGIIEGVLIPSLIAFGSPRGVAVLGVVSWRLVNFWAPIPAAAVCYVTLRTQDWQDRRSGVRRTAAVRAVLAQVGSEEPE